MVSLFLLNAFLLENHYLVQMPKLYLLIPPISFVGFGLSLLELMTGQRWGWLAVYHQHPTIFLRTFSLIVVTVVAIILYVIGCAHMLVPFLS